MQREIMLAAGLLLGVILIAYIWRKLSHRCTSCKEGYFFRFRTNVLDSEHYDLVWDRKYEQCSSCGKVRRLSQKLRRCKAFSGELADDVLCVKMD